jgi:116 kDa U5 small nuclear ribonucleoprotein component
LKKGDPEGPLLINIVKLFNHEACNQFSAFGRVFSGTLKKNQRVKVLGEAYTLEDEEDMTLKLAKGLFAL